MNENTKVYLMIGAGLLVVFLAVKLFGDSADEREAKKFTELWEFFDKDVLVTGVAQGLVSQQDVNAMQSNGAAARIAGEVIRLHAAMGTTWTRWGDDESAAVSAILQRNYPEQLLFNNTFQRFYGVTVGLFVLDYMTAYGWADDAEFLALLVRHTLKLRNQ